MYGGDFVLQYFGGGNFVQGDFVRGVFCPEGDFVQGGLFPGFEWPGGGGHGNLSRPCTHATVTLGGQPVYSAHPIFFSL